MEQILYFCSFGDPVLFLSPSVRVVDNRVDWNATKAATFIPNGVGCVARVGTGSCDTPRVVSDHLWRTGVLGDGYSS